MSYQGALRRKMLELKSLAGISYAELAKESGITKSTLQQFGAMKNVLSADAEMKLKNWCLKNGGGIDLLDSNQRMAH